MFAFFLWYLPLVIFVAASIVNNWKMLSVSGLLIPLLIFIIVSKICSSIQPQDNVKTKL